MTREELLAKIEAIEDVKLVGQFWPGETALESEDSNWRCYRRERYAQIITAFLELSQTGALPPSNEAAR